MHDSDQVYCFNIGTLQFCVAVTFQIGQVAHRTHNSINQRQNKSVTEFDFSKAAAAVISLARCSNNYYHKNCLEKNLGKPSQLSVVHSKIVREKVLTYTARWPLIFTVMTFVLLIFILRLTSNSKRAQVSDSIVTPSSTNKHFGTNK